MPNFKSTTIVRQEQLNSSAKAEASNLNGKLPLYERVTYTLLGTEVANDTIQLFDLPVGAVIVPQDSNVTCLDPGGTLTLDIGDAADPDRYADGIVLSAGGIVNFCATAAATMPAAVATPFAAAVATRIVAKIDTAATLTPGVVLYFNIVYRIRG